MNFFKLILSYQGTSYKGWQKQPEDKTVQGELERAIQKILKTQFRTVGSGRTDAGVHALNQVVKLECEASIKAQELRRGLNSLLPADIRVHSASKSDEAFHPILSARSKEYWYYFCENRELTPFESPFIVGVKGGLDHELMERAATLFVGEHDFSNYFCVGTEVPSNIRHITSCQLVCASAEEGLGSILIGGGHKVLKIEGNGFLKQMVRLIMGTIWNVGRGKISLEEVQNSLQNPQGQHLAPVAPPQGLYLANVTY